VLLCAPIVVNHFFAKSSEKYRTKSEQAKAGREIASTALYIAMFHTLTE